MRLCKILDQLQIIRFENKLCPEDAEVKHKSFWLVSQINFPNHLKEYGNVTE